MASARIAGAIALWIGRCFPHLFSKWLMCLQNWFLVIVSPMWRSTPVSFAVAWSVHCQGCGWGSFFSWCWYGIISWSARNKLVVEDDCEVKQVQGSKEAKAHSLCHPQAERDWSLPKGNGTVGAAEGPWGYCGCDVLHIVPTSQALGCSWHSGTACPTMLGSALGQGSWRGMREQSTVGRPETSHATWLLNIISCNLS